MKALRSHLHALGSRRSKTHFPLASACVFASVIALTLGFTMPAFAGDENPTSASPAAGADTNSAPATNSTNKSVVPHRSRSGQPGRPAASQTAPSASAAATAPSSPAPVVAAPSAAPPSETTAAAPAAAPSATPLTVRAAPQASSKPLTLASTTESTPIGYKIIAGVGVAAALGLWMRKRNKNGKKTRRSKIDVLGRQSVGVRSEILVVDVEGTRLLIGMTPSAIQTLAVLDSPDPYMETDEDSDAIMSKMAADVARRRQPAVSDPPPAFGSGGAGAEDDAEEILSNRVRTLLAQRKSSVPAAMSPNQGKTVPPSVLSNGRRASQMLPATQPPPRRSSMTMNAVTPGAIAGAMPARRRSSMNLAAVNGGNGNSNSNIPLLDETQSRRLAPRSSAIAGQAKGLLLSMEEPGGPFETQDGSGNDKSVRLGDW